VVKIIHITQRKRKMKTKQKLLLIKKKRTDKKPCKSMALVKVVGSIRKGRQVR